MKKIIAFGELLLRLDTKGFERFVQANEFVARYTGAEANAGVSLANFGMKAYAVAKVPANEIGQACLNYLQRFGLDTSLVVRGGNRLGLLYLETGAGSRPSKVIYDRAHSAFSESQASDYNWPEILAGKDWFHFSGTAPALGPNIVRVLEEALATARATGVKTSVDLNYRSTLWSTEKANQVMTSLLHMVDVFIGNEEHVDQVLGIRASSPSAPVAERNQEIAKLLVDRYGFELVALTMRSGNSASLNNISACLSDGNRFHMSREREVEIVDRIGGGDAFAGGLIYAMLAGMEMQSAVEFAVASSCLKHSIPGDFNLASLAEVEAFLQDSGSGRVQR